MHKTCPLLTALGIITAVPAYADNLPPVTPYRPSVASPAQLPAPGQLELELGGLSARGGGDRRDSLPYQLKLAFSDKWGILIGGEAAVADRQGDERTSGFGDTTFTVKRTWVLDEPTAVGLELAAKAPTAGDGIGSGKADYTINGIFSRDLGSVHMDLNLNETRQGAPDAGTGRMQAGWASSFSTQIADKWTATTELSGMRQKNAPHTVQLLAALTYSPTPRMAIDVGVAKGLASVSQDWSLFGGIVLPLANLR